MRSTNRLGRPHNLHDEVTPTEIEIGVHKPLADINITQVLTHPSTPKEKIDNETCTTRPPCIRAGLTGLDPVNTWALTLCLVVRWLAGHSGSLLRGGDPYAYVSFHLLIDWCWMRGSPHITGGLR